MNVQPQCIEIYLHKYAQQNYLTDERLKSFRDIKCEYLQLLTDKRNLVRNNITDKLDKLNSKLSQYPDWISEEETKIKTELLRLKPLYAEILIGYYIECKKWAVILEEKLGTRTDFKDNYANYHKTLMEWRKSALKQLLKNNPEEKTAISKLNKIKNLCNTFKNTKSQDFIKSIRAIIE